MVHKGVQYNGLKPAQHTYFIRLPFTSNVAPLTVYYKSFGEYTHKVSCLYPLLEQCYSLTSGLLRRNNSNVIISSVYPKANFLLKTGDRSCSYAKKTCLR